MDTKENIDRVMYDAAEAFQQYRKKSGQERAAFLRKTAEQIDALGDELIDITMTESNLSEARLKGERTRTTGQLKKFADLLEKGAWLQASIDTGDAERKPAPKPDIRKMLFPLGPVVVFGASNFPFAFSTAGGDTASALAAGCSVIVKSHPGHPKTSKMIAGAIKKAAQLTAMPENVFQHVEDTSQQAGQQLVQHPITKAASFTGSFSGGKALFDLAASREEPIPLFAEMGSINPVLLLPDVVKQQESLPSVVASSVLLGVGQFCTNPGLLLMIEEEGLDQFLEKLAGEITGAPTGKMLHSGIAAGYQQKKQESLAVEGVVTLAEVEGDEDGSGAPAVASVEAEEFIKNPKLSEEVFGPYSLVVKCKDEKQLAAVIKQLKGQLTTTVFATDNEINNYVEVIDLLQQRCGRIIRNGMPTGVEVCKSMQHGGPFPATTDARFTSVGTDAIYRFVRPLCFQDFPESLLPAELKDKNEMNILRCVDGKWTTESI